MKKKRSNVFKACVTGVTAVATALTVGLAACAKNDGSTDDGDTTVNRVDEQVIKNGDFEYYSDNKGLYPISTPDNWTGGTRGNSSASMSGIIDTKKERWDYLTGTDLPDELEANDDLESSDENKKDYNGALSDDVPYKNPQAATANDAKDEDKEYIANPFTHEYRYDSDGKIYDNGNAEVTTYKNDEDGRLYLDGDYEDPFKTSVLMIHNYRRNYYTGTEGYFTSSTTLTLQANTAAKISLWVKTSDLYFDGAGSTRTEVSDERGAYIQVDTEVGGHDVDSFLIKNINTEKLNPAPLTGEGESAEIDYAGWTNNGWVQYTVYVEASTFADTTVNLTLGLGEDDVYTVEGYAFFDDITFTQYVNKAEMLAAEENADFNDVITETNTAKPLSPDATFEYRVDERKYWQNNPDGTLPDDPTTEENYSKFNHFFIDFTRSDENDVADLLADGTKTDVKAGLTVEDSNTGKFVSSKGTVSLDGRLGVLPVDSNAHVPTKLGTDGINISSDLLANVSVDGTDENWKLRDGYSYSDVLTPELITAASLPGVVDGKTNALVMMSAMGAAYEAQISGLTGGDTFKLGDGEYALISFWVKTSDMNGKSAATVTVLGVDENGNDDEENTASFSIDSTTQAEVKINDAENVYNGWVNCFIRVANTANDGEKEFKIKVNFGETTIRGTTKTAYKSGWLAIANASMIKIDEDVYGYTSGAAHTASLSFTETTTNTSNVFDTEDGEKNVIKNDLALPASYTGMNGGSANVIPPADGKMTAYDETNKNKFNEIAFTGLLSKENLANYADNADWFLRLANAEGMASYEPEEVWNQIFGEYSLQPLLIINTPRTFDGETKIYNYGYRGNSQSVNADGYTAVTVRVKVSDGAIANVYLVEDVSRSGGEVLSYSLPEYNFWYDADGNILKDKPDEEATSSAQKRANIAYTLRKDGLYEREGKLYANFYNLSKYYDIEFEHESFYDGNGNLVSFEKLVQGETYFADAGMTKLAPHYLIAGGKNNNKVYKYCDGKDGEVCYYYVEDGSANANKKVYAIDTEVAHLRYDYSNETGEDYQYRFTIDNTNGEYTGKWITTTFYIHAGSETKNYRLELWSGERDEKSSYADSAADSYVIFDYSSISLDQSTYDGLVSKYVGDISAAYREIIEKLDSNDLNIKELEALAGADKKLDLYNYIVKYYAFSLFDSEAFIPFNGETNTDGNGYSFDYTESAESIAFLKVVDDGLPYGTTDKTNAKYAMSAFIDYSVIDKDIDIIGEPTAPDNSTDDDTDNTSGSNFWLLFTSISLVVVIIVVIAALFIRDFIKKRKRKKTAGKNSYNFNKNKRYVKKYIKANGEVEEITEGEVDKSLLSDEPAEDASEETVDADVETSSPATDGAEADENADGKPADEADGDKN